MVGEVFLVNDPPIAKNDTSSRKFRNIRLMGNKNYGFTLLMEFLEKGLIS